jgi:tyrosine-protein kinase Etk/Wzc
MQESLKILKPYLRGLPIIILCMLAGIWIAKKYLSYTTPMYESTTKLRLADVGESVTGANLFKDLDVFASANKIAAEIEVIKSHVLLEKVIDKLGYTRSIISQR